MVRVKFRKFDMQNKLIYFDFANISIKCLGGVFDNIVEINLEELRNAFDIDPTKKIRIFEKDKLILLDSDGLNAQVKLSDSNCLSLV